MVQVPFGVRLEPKLLAGSDGLYLLGGPRP